MIPYVGRNTQCISLNVPLKQYIAQNVNISILSNNCCSIVPYVKRVSLLLDILRQDSSLLPNALVDNDVNDVGKMNSQAVCQTTTLSWNGEDINFADLESCYEESIGLYHTGDTDFLAFHEETDPLTLTHYSVLDSQEDCFQQINAQNENDEFMNGLKELRAALSDDIQSDENDTYCSAIVLYNPTVSLWDPQNYDYWINKAAPLYRPIVSFCDERRIPKRFYQPERKRQIIRNQRNKCYRFTPYDKDYRTWYNKPPTINELPSEVGIPTKIKEKHTNACSMALVPYSGNSILDVTHKSKPIVKLQSVVLCSELVEYLTFCRNVTCQSTSKGMSSPKAPRGFKRRCENISRVLMKKCRQSESKDVPRKVLGDRNK